MTASPHEHALRVYYEDTDAGGVVYHARFLALAERARTEMLREAGAPHAALLRDHGLMFMVRRVEVEYLRPALLDDRLVVRSTVLALGAATAELRQDVLRPGGPGEGEALLASLLVRLACVRRDGRPARLPPRWRGVMAPGARDEGAGIGAGPRAAPGAASAPAGGGGGPAAARDAGGARRDGADRSPRGDGMDAPSVAW